MTSRSGTTRALSREAKLHYWSCLHRRRYKRYLNHLFVFEAQRFTLALNPKVATTFLKRRICEHLLGDAAPVGLAQLRATFPTLPFLASNLDASMVRRHLTSPDVRRLVLVRNPYARLLSAYRDKICRRTCYTYDKEIPGLRRYALALGLPAEEEGKPVPFDTFVRWVTHSPWKGMNGHWSAQGQVILSDCIQYTDVSRIEDGLPVFLQLLGERLDAGEGWQKTKTQRADNQNAPAKEQFYTMELADLVFKKFVADFESFGYDRGSWRDL